MKIESVATKQAHYRTSLFGAWKPIGIARRTVAGALAGAMLTLSPAMASAQYGSAPPPPPQDTGAQQGYGAPPPQEDYGAPGDPSAYQALPPEQLDSLVAPIALYPDSLVAQVLAAATYPAQVAAAEQFVQQSGNYPPDQLAQLANTQPWDPSVKSLVAFPQVLADLNQNMQWTTQLGNAYYNQPQDVLGAVQSMRQRAYAAGSLRTTPQLAVDYAPGDIVIAPVSPAVVYVPYYNPWVVYGAPIAVYPHYYYGPPRGVAFGVGLAVGFGVGIAVAAFTHFAWGFHSWAPNWHDRTVVFNHNTYISRSVTVINHGNYGRFDRAPEARAFNQSQAVRYGGNNRTINNVTINRGGNTFNHGANTYNNGGNTYNRGANTYNSGGNSFNRGANTYNSGGNTYNRGANTYNNGANTYNRGQQPGSTGAYNRPATPGTTQGYGHSGYNGQTNAQVRPQGDYNRSQAQANARPAPQQHSAPQESHGSNHESHESHDSHGGGHDDHHR